MAPHVPAYSTYDFVYKTVSNLDLKITFFLPETPSSSPQPVCLYFHGGGLFTGTRFSWIPEWLKNDCLTRGYGLATAGYRLLPQVSGHEIVDDIVDAYTFVYTKANELLPSKAIDTDRIFVAGNSSGGYCAAIVGAQASPRPKAVISVYGMVDIQSEWWNTPHPDDLIIEGRTRAPDYETRFVDVFESDIVETEVEVYDDPEWLPSTKAEELQYNRRFMLDESIRKGNFGSILTHEPGLSAMLAKGEPVPKKHQRVCPFFGVDRDYPPTAIIHGTDDTLVPLSASEGFEKVLKESNVKYVFLTAPGEHGFDGQPSEEVYKKVLKKAMQFVDEVL
jgi:acetyl esterase/lipase